MSGSPFSAIYGALLRLLPSSFRARYASEMRRTFEDEWRESGAAARLGIFVRAIVGALWTAAVVRVAPRRYATPMADDLASPPDGTFAGVSRDGVAALRGLRRRPAFAATAILTAALGVGATTAVFSVVDATVLRGIAVPESDRVMSLWGTFERTPGREFQIANAELADIRAEVQSFARVGAWGGTSVLLAPNADRDARNVAAALTYGDIYRIVGARTVLGRLPDANDDRLDAPRVAVLTHQFWTTVFGGDRNVIGQLLPVATQSATIIGVLAPGVTLPGSSSEVWIHNVLDPASWATNRSGHGLNVLGVLRPGATEASARAELAALQRTWATRYAGQHAFGVDGHAVQVASLGDRLLGTARRVGVLLSVAAAVLLLLACANVANLLLARGETRMSEVGVRIALGASSRRVAQPVLLEGLAIATIGGALGLVLAAAGLPALLRLAPADIASRAGVGIDLRVVAFAISVSIVTGLLFALRPALKAVNLEPATLLRTSGRGRSATMRGLRLLVAGQTALAALLLIGAALFARSLGKLTGVNPGLDPRSRVVVNLSLPGSRYEDAASVMGFYERLQTRVEQLGGVTRASFVRSLPLRDNQRIENVLREGESRAEDMVPITVQAAGTGMLKTLGIPLLEGRDFSTTDRVGSVRVAMINRAAAKVLWPNESAIGKRVTATFAPRDFGPITIIGVFGDVRSGGLTTTPSPEIVMPLAQATPWTWWLRTMRLVVETSGAGEANAAVLPEIRAVLREMDPAIAVELPTTMSDVMRASAARQRFLAALLAVFATLALVIAGVGVFGVVSFSVARQTRELAIRSALGAGRADILRDVLRTNAGVAAIGAVVGGVVAAVASPALSGFLYDVSPRDGVVLAGAPLALIGVAVLACLVPAIKAMRVPAARALQDAE
jgi:putative ABC transport system permease protein